MLVRKLAALQDIADALLNGEEKKRAVLPFLQDLEVLKETVRETVQDAVEAEEEAPCDYGGEHYRHHKEELLPFRLNGRVVVFGHV